jgi:hypothetical protein
MASQINPVELVQKMTTMILSVTIQVCVIRFQPGFICSHGGESQHCIPKLSAGPCGSVVANRYKILREVGLGTFGRVVECLDLKRRQGDGKDAFVALKIVRSIKRYHDSALIEARIVEEVNRRGGRGRSHFVVMHDSFSYQGHFCMVFESLGPSLYDFMKRHDYQPFPMACVQDFTIQLLEALEFLHSFRLIHTDLKIENILLMVRMLDLEYNCPLLRMKFAR